MIDNATWEEIFSADTPKNMQVLIEVSDGTYLTNTEISQESINLVEQLSDEEELRFGGCNAAIFKLRIRASVENLTNKRLTVKLYAYDDWDRIIKVVNGTPVLYNIDTGATYSLGNDPFILGQYTVLTDRPSPNRQYRDIMACDDMEKIVSSDITQWYESLFATYPTVTLKFLRESLLNHFGISYEAFTGVNDSISVGKNIISRPVSGKIVLAAICELNGCFGYITRDNKFRCKVLSSETTDKEYERYVQGEVDYQDALANIITQVKLVNEQSQASATIGVAGNTYLINDNELLSGLDEATLTTVASNLLPVLSVTAYRPFRCKTYGDPCVELGDWIEIPTDDKTIEAFLLYRELSGTQAMRDVLEAKGEEKNSARATGNAAQISRFNSALAAVTEKNALEYYLFRTATDMTFEDGDDPKKIAQLRYVSTDDTTVNILHEFKLDCDISSGSDRIKAYVTYVHDGVTIDYQPIETWNLSDYHMLDLQYAYDEIEPQTHTWEVYLNVVGGDATMYAGDGSITLHGQGLITREDWGGLIEVEDVFSLAMHGKSMFRFTEEITAQTKENAKIEIAEIFSLAMHGTSQFRLTDNDTSLIVRQNVYRRVTEDGKVRVTEDGKTRVTEGGNE